MATASLKSRALSPRAARSTDYVPCLTGNPHTGQQRAGTLYLHHKIDLVPVLYDEESEDDAASGGLGDLATLMGAVEASGGGGGVIGRASSPTVPFPEQRSTYLAMLSVPSHMIPGDLLHFVSPFREDIRLMRILSHALPTPSRGPYTLRHQAAKYIVLLEMSSQAAADAFFAQHAGRPFNSLEPTPCLMAYAKGLALVEPQPAATGSATSSSSSSSAPPSSSSSSSSSIEVLADLDRSHGDLPQCVVCLEPLRLPVDSGGGGGGDETVSSPQQPGGAARVEVVVMTACNHAFHMDCIRNLASPLCPVCRYNHDSVSSASVCSECRRTTDLWVCLICGNIGCGRYHSQHSRKHYLETLHAYAMEVQTQQVWDFAGDGYVHRLIYHKGEEASSSASKLVEVADPQHGSDQRPHTAPLSDRAEEEMMHRKLESWALQYSLMLSSGLEEQRLAFERRLIDLKAAQQHDKITAAKLLAARRVEKKQLEQRCVSAKERLSKVKQELGFLAELNASLEANKTQLEEQIQAAEDELASAHALREVLIPPLEQRVRELMLQLDGQAGGTDHDDEEEDDHRQAGAARGKEEGAGRAGSEGRSLTQEVEAEAKGGKAKAAPGSGVEEAKAAASASGGSAGGGGGEAKRG